MSIWAICSSAADFAISAEAASLGGSMMISAGCRLDGRAAGHRPRRTDFARLRADESDRGATMSRQGWLTRCTLLLGALGLVTASSGCQTTIGGQTLPAAYYLTDDIQFFPAGDEFLLPETVRAMDEYRAQQAGFIDDLEFEPDAGLGVPGL
jgi:hypothetical protein